MTDSDLYEHHHLSSDEWAKARAAMGRLAAVEGPESRVERKKERTQSSFSRRTKAKPKTKRRKSSKTRKSKVVSSPDDEPIPVTLSVQQWRDLVRVLPRTMVSHPRAEMARNVIIQEIAGRTDAEEKVRIIGSSSGWGQLLNAGFKVPDGTPGLNASLGAGIELTVQVSKWEFK